MSLKIGEWEITVNGFEGTMTIQDVKKDGTVEGFIKTNVDNTNLNFLGVWDKTSQSISFGPLWEHVPNGRNNVISEYFQGFLFSSPPNPEPGQDVIWTLSGFFQVNEMDRLKNAYSSNSRRSKFGWFAQMTEED